ncbi:uncharacterized protein LOC124673016 [Lolium rigidum]|uniref:uncharacterized protein LOC124673016 n=1 Tax=Lolium rigidum TaxID=89674 RepID=UPI001F5C1A7B|nr:uncharacterized protein LOC124673016 [Lolium rigidum]
MAVDGGGGTAAPNGEDDWLRLYGRVVAILPQVEALAAARARLEVVNALQHEFWEARDALLQHRLLQAEESVRSWEAAYIHLQPSGDDQRFAELQQSDLEDLATFVDVFAAENAEFQIKVKEVDAGADHSQNPADHERITEDLKAELQKLKQAYEALCSEKDKKVAEITAERDFVRDQFKTLERDYADLRSYMNNKSTRDSEAALELQKNVEQLQLASQKKDEEIRKLRARVKAAEAKRKLVPESKLQKMDSTPKKIDKEIEKCKDRQPEASKKHKKDTSGTPKKGCSEGPALVVETRNYSSKQMLTEDGQPEASQKRKCATFLSSNDGQNGNDEETHRKVLEPLKKKMVSGKKGVEQGDNKAKADGKGHTESKRSPDKLAIYNALLYLRSVKDSFTDKPEKHKEFLVIQSEFVSRKIGVNAFISAVAVLLDGHPELIRGFKSCFTYSPTQVRLNFRVLLKCWWLGTDEEDMK